MTENAHNKISRLEEIMITAVTTNIYENRDMYAELSQEYAALRVEVMNDLRTALTLPDLVTKHRSLQSFSDYLRPLAAKWQERRVLIRDQFSSVFLELESKTNAAFAESVPSPSDDLGSSRGTCFVLMPFREPINSYYTPIIATAIRDVGLEPLRADEITKSGAIVDQIWKGIRRSVVCVAELTGQNANVMYELGLAHALGKPVVSLVQSMDDIPFDLKHLRHIVYHTSTVDWNTKLRTDLGAMLRSTLSNPRDALVFR